MEKAMSEVNEEVRGAEESRVHVDVRPSRAAQGTIVIVSVHPEETGLYNVNWRFEGATRLTERDVSIDIIGETTVATGPIEVSGEGDRTHIRALVDTARFAPGAWMIRVGLTRTDDEDPQTVHGHGDLEILPRVLAPGDDVTVTMRRAEVPRTRDQALWAVIRNSTDRLGFDNYSRFMDLVMCGPWVGDGEDGSGPRQLSRRERAEFSRADREICLPFSRVHAWRLLRVATEVFMMLHCGVEPDFAAMDLVAESRRFGRSLQPGDIQTDWENYLVRVYTGDDYEEAIKAIPYLELIRLKLQDVPVTGLGFGDGDGDAGACYGILADKLARPCFIELIWTYWMSEARLPHTLNAVAWRFQNRTRRGGRDPLRNLEIDPLRRLNNLMWGYIQDEQHRLTAERIAYECVHEYGVSPSHVRMRPVRAADSRSRFMEAFHHLLALCREFYKQDDNTNIVADGFPVLNALRETHLLITQGAHNQYGDLPWVARTEGLMQQWLLGRPEMREFLPGRTMVAYPERWMDRVEAMKTLQGWDDTPVLLFRDLAVFGEQILLGIRYGAWATVSDPEQAANFVRYSRSAIQAYSHAAEAVAEPDRTSSADVDVPAIGRQRRHAVPHNGR
jgi:hypothetical protein